MRAALQRATMMMLAFPLTLTTGCLFTTRKLPVPKAPTVVQNATAEELVARLNQRWDSVSSFYANVEIQLSTQKSKEGIEKDYTSIPGIIMIRKPEMLRVLGFVPVVHTRAFDMVSNGEDFTLYMPSKDLAYEGPNALTHRSSNMIENLRPGFFLDALIVRGIAPQDEYMLTTDSDTVEDPKKKHLLIVPEYVLNVMRHKPGGQEDQPIRVVHFHRDDLLPYEQDLYDQQGNPETLVTYGRYVQFGDSEFPSTVTIKRPQEEFQIVLTVTKVTQNMNLKDDQFQLEIPPDTKIQHLQ